MPIHFIVKPESSFLNNINIFHIFLLQNCDSSIEECCAIQPDQTPQAQSTSCYDSNSACVAPKYCLNGYISAEQKNLRTNSVS